MQVNSETPASGTPSPSEHIWFDDGTIVLRTVTVLFKVYKGVLAMHSPIFQDLIGLPQTDKTEQLDGCPVVDVHDSADDWRHLLRAIFEPNYLDTHMSTDFSVFVGVLRLSTKYEIAYFRDRMVQIAKSEWPTDLLGYSNWVSAFHPSTRNLSRRLGAAAILRETGLSGPRVVALMMLTTHSTFEELFDSYSTPNGPYPLSIDDLRRCICGRERLYRIARTKHLSQLGSGYRFRACRRSPHCSDRAPSMLADILGRYDNRKLSPLLLDVQRVLPLCKECAAEFALFYNAALSETWEAVPEIFGFPKWEVLKEQDDNA